MVINIVLILMASVRTQKKRELAFCSFTHWGLRMPGIVNEQRISPRRYADHNLQNAGPDS